MTKKIHVFPHEVRHRAVRMVLESQGEYDSHGRQFVPLPQKIGLYTRDSACVGSSAMSGITGSGDGGLTTAERQRLKRAGT